MKDCTLIDLHLAAYAAGDLAEPELSAVDDHLGQCETCRAELARENELRTLLSGLPQVECPATVTASLAHAMPREGSQKQILGLLDATTATARSSSWPKSWWPTGLGLIAATLLVVLIVPGLLDDPSDPAAIVVRVDHDTHEFTTAEIDQARREVIATLALAAEILDRSRDKTVVDVFGSRLPRAVTGSLRSHVSDAQETTNGTNTAHTGGNG